MTLQGDASEESEDELAVEEGEEEIDTGSQIEEAGEVNDDEDLF
jgi:hypothetical protein